MVTVVGCTSPGLGLLNALESIELKTKDGTQVQLPNMDAIIKEIMELEQARMAGEISPHEYRKRVTDLKRRKRAGQKSFSNFGGGATSGGGEME